MQELQREKNLYRNRLLEVQNFPEVAAPGLRMQMDTVRPLTPTKSGNKYILTCIDAFSRYPEIIAMPDQKAETVARMFVKPVICRHGCPAVLVTDNGANFVSALMKNVCKLLAIDKIHTTAYHSQSNGVIERYHRTLKDMLYHSIDRD